MLWHNGELCNQYVIVLLLVTHRWLHNGLSQTTLTRVTQRHKPISLFLKQRKKKKRHTCAKVKRRRGGRCEFKIDKFQFFFLYLSLFFTMESKATMGDDNAITAFHMLKFLGRKVEKDDILGYVCYPPDRAKEVIFYHLKDLLEMVGCENHPAEKYLRKGDNKTLYGVSNLVTLNSFGMRDIPTLLKNAPPTPATASILQEVPGARHLGLRNTPYLRDQATMPRKVRVSGLFSRSGIKTVEDVENALMAHNIPVRRSTHSERDIVEKQKLYEKLSQVIIDYLNAKTQPVTRNERVYLHVGII